jgi:hypothetical protein
MSVKIIVVPSKGIPVHEMIAKANQLALRLALCAWGVGAYMVACGMALIPQGFAVATKLPEPWFHWQIWLLAGILMFAVRDVFTDLRCVDCGAKQDLLVGRWLLTRRLLCRDCRELEAALQAPLHTEAVEPEYADLFEALK